MNLRPRPDTIAAKQGITKNHKTNLTDLEPGEYNPHEHTQQYNPLNYCYKLIITELNMELVIKFILETLDHKNKTPITFTTPNNHKHTIPFFPKRQEGQDPAQRHTGGTPNHNDYYHPDEHTYSIIPTIVRAAVLGNGMNTEPVLVTQEFVRTHITPERLLTAIEEFRDQVENDMNAPNGLLELLNDATNHYHSYLEDNLDDDLDDDLDW